MFVGKSEISFSMVKQQLAVQGNSIGMLHFPPPPLLPAVVTQKYFAK